MKSTLQQLALAMMFLLASVPSALGQNYPKPWKQGGTPTVCPNDDKVCPGVNSVGQTNIGLKTFPYASPVVVHTGRFLDSSFTTNFQYRENSIRTLRARRVRIARTQRGNAPPRAYIQLGSSVGVYSLSSFFTSTLPSGMVSIKLPFPKVFRSDYVPENVAKWQALIHPEGDGIQRIFGVQCQPNKWCCPYGDGQDRMRDFDFDDRGYVYLAVESFGWGIVKDNGETGGETLDFVSQVLETSSSLSSTGMITVLKTGGKYYVVATDDVSQEARIVHDVTDPANPTAVGSKKLGPDYAFISWAKDDANERIALIVGGPKNRRIEIYNYSTLASGGSPLVTFEGGAKDFKDVTVDENGNFWTAEVTEGLTNNAIIKLEKTATGYTKRSFDVFGEPFTSETLPHLAYGTVEYGDKYLTVVGRGAGKQQDVRLFKIEGGEPVPINLNYYFRNYYWSAPQDYAEPPGSDQSYGAYPIKWNNKLYLIQSTLGLGDVFELQAGDSISVSQKAATLGTANPYAKSTESGPFYGDILRFTAASSNPSFPYSLNWDFGNPDSPENQRSGRTGDDIDHQFTGLNTAAKVTAAKAVRATATADAEMTDAVSVTLKLPTARIGIKGTNIVVTADSSALDVVAGDELTDSSDGIVQGHFSAWTLDTSSSNKKPDETLPVGAVGPHTVTLATNYGAYNTSFATVGQPYVDSVSGISYTVRPFVAAFGTHTKSGSTVTFKGTARKTSLTALMSATSWTVQWSLKTASGTDVVPPTSATVAVGTVPDFAVAAAIPNKSKLKLRISVDLAGLAPEAANYAFHEIEQELITPDPKITRSGCANVGEPCSFTVTSTAGNPITGWTFLWTLKKSGVQVGTATGTTFTPSLSEAGSYTASVKASTTIFEGTDDDGPFTVEGPVCGALPADNLISIYASCKKDCPTNTDITLRAEAWGYQYQGCEEYLWKFGDGSTLTTTDREIKHKYTAKGNKQVSLRIRKGTATSAEVFDTIGVGTTIIDPQPTCTAPSNIGVGFNGNKGCRFGEDCKTGEVITFTATRGLSGLQSCDSTTWTFGDNSSGSGSPTTHTFNTPGTYTVGAVVSNTYGEMGPVNVTVTVVPDNNCAAPPAASQLYIEYKGAQSNCTGVNKLPCQPNEAITFKPRGFPVDNFQGCDRFEWNFGDSTSPSSAKEPQHSFAGNVASYRVSMRVYNDTNTTGSTVTIDVPFPVAIKPLPKLAWSSFPVKGSKGFPVTFTVLSDIDATGWIWDFGDNSSDNSQAALVAKTASVTHTYATKGTYSVSVRARNAEDSSAAPTDIEVGTITVDDLPEYRYLLPVVAHASGIGSTWRTDVQIYTPDLTISPANPLSLTASFKGIDYPLLVNKSTFIYEDFLSQLRPGQNDSGPVIITVRTQHAPQIWTRTYNQTDAGTFGQFIPAVRLDTAGAGSAVGEGRYHLAGLQSTTRYRTNIGIVNPNANTIPVTLRLYDDVNVPYGAAITKQLAPFQLDQFPITGPADRPFSAEIEVPDGSWLIAYASLIDGGSSDPVYMQAIRSSELASADYRTSVIPGVGHVGDWRSDVTIFNPYNHTVTVDLDYHDQTGAKVASATSVPVGPGMFLQYSDLLKQGILGSVADSLGMLRVSVPTTVSADSFPMTFARTYNDNGTGKTYGQGIPGFAASRANVKPDKAALIPAVRSDSSYKTNLGLTNVSTTTATVNVKVLDPIAGGEIASYSYTLEANQSLVAPDLNLNGRTSASLRVEVTGGSVWAFASIIDRGTLDPEYVAATPLP